MSYLCKVCLFVPFLWWTNSFGQLFEKNEILSKKNLILFGEEHFVNEKYEEIKKLVFEIAEQKTNINEITVFLELPHSFQYALDALTISNDSTVLIGYFENMYYKKGHKLSSFWIDMKNLIYEITAYAQKRGINVRFKSVDIEREYRRAAYILSEFYEEKTIGGVVKNSIDSLLNELYIMDVSENAELLQQNIVNAVDLHPLSDLDKQFLLNIRNGLKINNLFCPEREVYMYNHFISHYKNDTSSLYFGVFGLAHVFPELMYEKDRKLNDFVCVAADTTKSYKPFLMHFPKEILERTYTVAIVALNYCNPLFSKKVYGSLPTEYEYLQKTVPKDSVLRIETKKDEQLQSYSKSVDYLIVYDCSFFKK